MSVSTDDDAHIEAKTFQVHLRGIIDLLGRHIYSSPRVFVRELLQNARDAVVTRDRVSPSPRPTGAVASVRVVPAFVSGPDFVIEDDGIGLTPREIDDVLATVGWSSKHDELGMSRPGLLGQFGVGLLSGFMVADRIQLVSRSALGGRAVEWIGCSDGTYTIRTLSQAETARLGIGTRVSIRPRADDVPLCSAPSVLGLVRQYGEFLDVDIAVDMGDGSWKPVTRSMPFTDPSATSEEVGEFCREVFGFEPFEWFPITIASTATAGIAFVVPHTTAAGARRRDRIYSGGMLVNEAADVLLPEWAFFLRVCVDTRGIDVTASREGLVENEALQDTRAQLEVIIRRWVLGFATSDPARFSAFLGLHSLALKSLVVSDDDIARLVIPLLLVETSAGAVRISALLGDHRVLRYAATIDEFQQVAGLAPHDDPIINAGYVHGVAIMERIAALFPHVAIERIAVFREIDRLDVPALSDRKESSELETRASRCLQAVSTTVAVRRLAAASVPSLFVVDPLVIRALDRDRTELLATGIWREVMGELKSAVAARPDEPQEDDGPMARLCLNWSNELVRMIARVNDPLVFDRAIQLLYVQGLLAAHKPLSAADRMLLNSSVGDLIQLSIEAPGVS
jgi:molecular chaperone HtpG